MTDSEEAILVCIDGTYLESLFNSHPQLPGRFFSFLAAYQASRLQTLTAQLSKDKHEIAGQNISNVSIQDIFKNPACAH